MGTARSKTVTCPVSYHATNKPHVHGCETPLPHSRAGPETALSRCSPCGGEMSPARFADTSSVRLASRQALGALYRLNVAEAHFSADVTSERRSSISGAVSHSVTLPNHSLSLSCVMHHRRSWACVRANKRARRPNLGGWNNSLLQRLRECPSLQCFVLPLGDELAALSQVPAFRSIPHQEGPCSLLMLAAPSSQCRLWRCVSTSAAPAWHGQASGSLSTAHEG